MHAALTSPGPSPPPTDLDLAVAELRAAHGWPAAARVASAARVLAGGHPVSIRQLRRDLQAAGRLEAFPHAPPGHGRPRKPALTAAECKLATTIVEDGGTWDDAANAVNAGRPPEDRISERTLRDRLKGASS